MGAFLLDAQRRAYEEDRLKPRKRKNKGQMLYAPVVPQYIFSQINNTFRNNKYSKKTQFLTEVCKYWALKREQRKGAPLLKRLHLEVFDSFSIYINAN